MSKVVALDTEDQFFFSDKTDPVLAQQLKQANSTRDPAEKEILLLAALKQWPQALDTYIALYKFYFRTGQYRQAEAHVWHTLREAAKQGGFNRNYRRLGINSAPWLADQSIARLYLFSLKALGVIRLRRGRVKLAEQVLDKLLELDPTDELGGGNFLNIARSFSEEELA